jgi:redox-sensing transcriptional repressor
VDRSIPRATVARLPRYLQYLNEFSRPTASSDDIAEGTGLQAAQVRRDLSYLGPGGTRGVGYEVARLRALILRALGLLGPVGVAIIGAGNLGQALAGYGGFHERGFSITGVYDVDPKKVGSAVHGHRIKPIEDVPADAAEGLFAIAILATPPEAAAAVTNMLAAAGIRSLLNFAPTVIRAPSGVEVRNVDLSTELQILSYYRVRPKG